MKRRGFKPNTRTFHTLLSGFGAATEKLQDSDLLRAEKIHEQFQAYCEAQTPGSPNLDVLPTNDYLRVLNNGRDSKAMFRLFWSMPTTGPLSPDLFTFTELIRAIRTRRVLHTGEDSAPIGSRMDVDLRNAEDALFLWKRLVQAASRGRFDIDAHVITPTLSVLAKGSKECQDEGFAIVKEYLGLSDEVGGPMTTPKIKLSGHVLAAAQQLALLSRKLELRLQFVRNIMLHKNEGIRSILVHQHLLCGLESLSDKRLRKGDRALGVEALQMIEWMMDQESRGGIGLGLRPNIDAYTEAIFACKRLSDWRSAVRLIELMSGYKLDDFGVPLANRAYGQPPSNNSLPLRFVILPNVSIMASLMQIAIKNVEEKAKKPYRHEDLLPLYSILRFAHHLGVRQYFEHIPRPEEAKNVDIAEWIEKKKGQRRLAVALEDVVKLVKSCKSTVDANLKPTDWELKEWSEMTNNDQDASDEPSSSDTPKTWQRKDKDTKTRNQTLTRRRAWKPITA